jgi:hypothetical protein
MARRHALAEKQRSPEPGILATFPTQHRYQDEQCGEYRSRRLILEAFDDVRG